MSGTLYLVGTPIGNLKDITLRALETLQNADIIASEDTRHTKILLEHYKIKKPLISYYKHKEQEGAAEIIGLLEEGKSVALVTDAGMPCISDPGAVLVKRAREKGLRVTVVPGASAVISALSLTGTGENGFLFLGFLPEKQKGKKALLESVKGLKLPLVFYAAPHNLDSDIAFLNNELGNRRLFAVKEITKVYETVYEGSLNDIDIENKKGEFVLIVDGAADADEGGIDIKEELKRRIASGMTRSDAVKAVAKEFNLSKNAVYSAGLSLHEPAEQGGEDGSGN